MNKRRILDSDGDEVRAGMFISFSYGIPPVGVRARVVERDGRLIALTPGHNPSECSVRTLKQHVGDFWIIHHSDDRVTFSDASVSAGVGMNQTPPTEQEG